MDKNLEQRVTELEKLVKELRNDKTKNNLKGLKVGDVFELAGLKWKILDITEDGCKCLADKLENKMIFDSNGNDWRNSSLRKYLNGEFLEMLSNEIGEDNIVEFERDLLSLDGQTEYETCMDKVSLLTVDEYRKYRNLIPNTEDDWWWTCTPWSIAERGFKYSIAVVSSSGSVSRNSCDIRNGVRPFVSFSSSIFESEE